MAELEKNKNEIIVGLTDKEIQKRTADLHSRVICSGEDCVQHDLYADLTDEELQGGIKVAIRILRTSDSNQSTDVLIWHLITEQSLRSEDMDILSLAEFDDNGVAVTTKTPKTAKGTSKTNESKTPKVKPRTARDSKSKPRNNDASA